MRPFRAVLALVLAAGSAFAQTGSPAQEAAPAAVSATPQPEVPFVSRLLAQPVPEGIKLTWIDSPDVVGTGLIYRSPTQITAQNLGSAALAGSVPSGVETWIDTPPDTTPWFYAVVMEDARGKRYPLAIPFRNVTTVAVAYAAAQPAAAKAAAPVETSPAPAVLTPAAAVPAPAPAVLAPAPAALAPAPAALAPAPAAQIAPAAPAAAATRAAAPAPQPATVASVPAAPPAAGEPARITGISAVLAKTGDAISVTFATSNPARDLLLFWSSTPIATRLDLLRAGSAATLDPGTTRYVLPAPPGAAYWFAVLDAGLYRIGQTPLVPGFNTTAAPVQVPAQPGQAGLSTAGARRAVPLPTLAPSPGANDGGAALPSAQPVSAATEAAIQQLLKAAAVPATPPLAPAFLPGDQGNGSGTAADGILDIVHGSFVQGDMGGAEQKLLDYLSVPRSRQADARARFYLGQSYWFLGMRREALLEFLAASEFYYPESQPWIDQALGTLGAQDTGGQ